MSQSVRARPSTADETDSGCPECSGEVLPDGQESVCESCGLVVGEYAIDHGPDWRAFTATESEERSHVGRPATEALHDKGLATVISWTDRDVRGRRLSAEKRRRMCRLRRENKRGQFSSKFQRNRAEAFGEIHRMASALGFDQYRREQACHLFKQAHEAGLLPGRVLEGFASAAIYAVARLNRDEVLLDQIVTVARVSERKINNAYSEMNRELGLPTPPPRPQQYIGKICSELGLRQRTRSLATDIADEVGDTAIVSGGKANGVAAACVSIAASEIEDERQPTQIDIADAAEVSTVTVRNRRREIREVVDCV